MSETPETDDWIEPDGLRFVDAESLDAVIRQRDEAVKLRDEEIAEFNAGCDAYKNGVRFADLEVGPHDQTGIGYAWAAFDDLRKQRDEAVALVRRMISVFGVGAMRRHEITISDDAPIIDDMERFLATLDRTEKP
jgi:hypothetical protein